jgi:hypothetical protein
MLDDPDNTIDHWLAVNAQRSQRLPGVVEKEAPLPGAENRRAAFGF